MKASRAAPSGEPDQRTVNATARATPLPDQSPTWSAGPRQPRAADSRGRRRAGPLADGGALIRPPHSITAVSIAQNVHGEPHDHALGLIGLGRIGAFHTETLLTLPAVDALVVTDAAPTWPRPSRPKRRRGRRQPPTARRRRRRRGGRRRHRAHAELHARRRRTGHARRSARSRSAPSRRERPGRRADRAPGVPVQVGYQRRFDAGVRRGGAGGRRRPVTRAGCTPSGDDARPRSAAARTTSGLRRASSATAPCTTSTRCAGSPARRSVEVYATGTPQGDPVFADSATSTPPRSWSRSTAAPWAWSRPPVQRPRLRLPPRGARLRRHRRRRAGRRGAGAEPRTRAPSSRPASRTASSWTGSPRPSAPSWPHSSTSPGGGPPVHRRRRRRGGLARRGRHRVPAREPPVRVEEVR